LPMCLIGWALGGRTIDRLGDCVIVDRPLAESYTVDSSSAKIGIFRVIRQRLFNTRTLWPKHPSPNTLADSASTQRRFGAASASPASLASDPDRQS
jgi:hypothetical protein